MSDVVSGLLAKLDEEEAAANRMGHANPDDGGYYSCPAVHTEPYGDLPWGEDACDCGLKQRRESVLRLCQAHRDIVNAYGGALFTQECHPEYEGNNGYVRAMRDTLRILARGLGVEETTDGQ